MNKVLWEKVVEGKVKSIAVKDESFELVLDDGYKVTFSTNHDQDCCEHVYGDFSIAQYHESKLVNENLTKIEVKAIDGMGFLLCFSFKWGITEKIFIACHNEQNGYYSSELDLEIDDNGTKTTININEFVEDCIN